MGVLRYESLENNSMTEWLPTLSIFALGSCLVFGIFKRFKASMSFNNSEISQKNTTVEPRLGTYKLFSEESVIIVPNERNSSPEVTSFRPILNEAHSSPSVTSFKPLNNSESHIYSEINLPKSKPDYDSKTDLNKRLNKTLITSSSSKQQDEKPKVLTANIDPDSVEENKVKRKDKKSKTSKEKEVSKDKSHKKKSKDKSTKSSTSDKEKKKSKKSDKKEKKKDEKTPEKKKVPIVTTDTLNKKEHNIIPEKSNDDVVLRPKNVQQQANTYEVINETPKSQPQAFTSSWDMVAEHRRNLNKEVKFQPPATNLRDMAIQKKMNRDSSPNDRNLLTNANLSIGKSHDNEDDTDV